MSVKPNINLAIVGAGVHALTLALYLLQKRKDMGDRFLAFDPSGEWLTQWHRQFAAQEIPHLRSPAVHHPDPDPFALRRFAENRPNELFPPYDLPSTKLFRDFCQNAIALIYECKTSKRSQLTVRISCRGRCNDYMPRETGMRPRSA